MKIPGMVEIGANEVGIVRKKFGSKLCPGRYIALNKEAGYQADILPPGMHLNYFAWEYEIRKVPVINIPQGEIGLVVAKDGRTISLERNLGKVVECNNFQDARAFLENGGEKGRQLEILRSGIYQINMELFTVITTSNADQHNVNPDDLKVCEISPDRIGIVTTKDGKPLPKNDIAGKKVNGHNNFQDPQQFLDYGGYRGLQEEILTAGFWNLNPWFVEVKQVFLTKVPPGTVGVVISHVGKNSNNNLVEDGYKGIQKKTLPTQKYPVNTQVNDVVIVPTHDIILDWSDREKSPTNYDANLHAIKLNSSDGFEFFVHLTQLFSIPAENTPIMISRLFSEKNVDVSDLTDDSSSDNQKFTSIRSLVMRVIEPMVKAHFTATAQKSSLRYFKDHHSQIQKKAAYEIGYTLNQYGVKAIKTSISQIDFPDDMESLFRERAKIEEIKHNIQKEKEKNIVKHLKELEETEAQINQDRVRKNFDIESKQQEIHLNAESIRLQGIAEADVIEAKLSAEVNALGGIQYYLAKLRTEKLPQIKLPNVLVGSNGSQSALLEAFIAPMLDSSTPQAVLANSAQLRLSGENSHNVPQLEAALPRCPVIFLLDTSSSLSSEYLEKLIQGINTFEQQLSNDETASRCIEVSMITFGDSAKVVQPFSNAGNFSLHQFELNGKAATGRGIELALKIIEHRQKIYSSQNIQHYQPWVFLITGSNPDDDWQEAVQQVKQLVGDQKLNFLTVGVENADMNILNQIAPPKFPATMLEGLKFKPLFYGLADLMKRIAHRQEKESMLEGLGNAVEEAKSSLPPEQAEAIVEYAAKIMSEVSKERPSRQEYSSNPPSARQDVI